MKVLFVSHSTGLSEGSVVALLSVVKELLKRGCEVWVVFPDKGPAKRVCDKLGAKSCVIPLCDSIYPLYSTVRSFLAIPYKVIVRCVQNCKAVKRIAVLIGEFKPDVVHTNVGTLNVGYYAAKIKGVPHVWHIREIAEKNLGWRPFPSLSYKKRLQRNNDTNIAITKEVFGYYQLDWENSVVIYDGVFNSGTFPEICENKDRYFLFVGRIAKNKGTQWAVDAFRNIKDGYPGYKLLIAGDGEGRYADALKIKCKSDIEAGRIQFLGYVSDVYSLMRHATALLVPSEMEGFGFVTAEAMYNGCLVIGRNTGGTKEQFDNGLKQTMCEIGLRFETEKGLEEAMAAVCKNGIDYYSDMITKAQRTAASLYTIERSVDQILTVYKKIDNKN